MPVATIHPYQAANERNEFLSEVFSALEHSPYWWDEAPRADVEPDSVPQQVDVLIVGGGFSGLCTARVLARAGCDGLVCQSAYVGAGASTRNGGMLGPSFHKLGVEGLKAHYGEKRTHALLRESVGFVDFIRDLLQEEGIDCDFARSGRFRCASRPAHYERMARETEGLVAATGIEAEAVPRSGVRGEIGTDRFYGGIRYQIDAGLHPGKYHDGLVRAVQRWGGRIVARTVVTGIDRVKDAFRVSTTRGTIRAGQVAVCTNAYTGRDLPWFRRRIIPIRSSIIATEPMSGDAMDELMPARRMYGDSRRIQAYYRPSPDGTRILFGGRATSQDLPLRNAQLLRESLLDIFPELSATKITHSWSGLVGYAFDHVPHLGRHDGCFYAMGYCGSGVARASYFGTKLGYKMLGDVEKGACSFDDLPFRSRPLYYGKPWFLPAIVRWHRVMDRFGI